MPKDEYRPPPGSVPIRTSYICVYIFKRTDDGHKFLILKRNTRYMFGLWQQVAGRIEQNETAAQAALRETEEETGIRPKSLYSVDIIESFYETEHNCIHFVPVFVAEMGADDNIVLSHEHSQFRWVSAAEAKEILIFVQQKLSIDLIEREFILKEPPKELQIKF